MKIKNNGTAMNVNSARPTAGPSSVGPSSVGPSSVGPSSTSSRSSEHTVDYSKTPSPCMIGFSHLPPSDSKKPLATPSTSTATSVITQSLNLIGNTFSPVLQQSKNEAAATAAGAEPDGAARVFDLEDDVLAYNFYTEELRKWTEESRNSRPIPTNPSSQSKAIKELISDKSKSKLDIPPLDFTSISKTSGTAPLSPIKKKPDKETLEISANQSDNTNRFVIDIKKYMGLHVFGQFSTDNGTPIDGETYTISKNELTFENIEDDALLKHNCTYKENLTINEKQVSGFFQQTSPDYKHPKFELISGINYTIHAPNATISGPLTNEGNFVSNQNYSIYNDNGSVITGQLTKEGDFIKNFSYTTEREHKTKIIGELDPIEGRFISDKEYRVISPEKTVQACTFTTHNDKLGLWNTSDPSNPKPIVHEIYIIMFDSLEIDGPLNQDGSPIIDQTYTYYPDDEDQGRECKYLTHNEMTGFFDTSESGNPKPIDNQFYNKNGKKLLYAELPDYCNLGCNISGLFNGDTNSIEIGETYSFEYTTDNETNTLITLELSFDQANQPNITNRLIHKSNQEAKPLTDVNSTNVNLDSLVLSLNQFYEFLPNT
jgi:hypothetical protein